MKKVNKNSTIARQQKSGIKNINILKILAFFTEVVKGERHNDTRTAFLIILAVLLGMKFAEILGRWLAYNL